MEINLKFEYKDMPLEELENWLFRLQGLSGGKIYSISKIKDESYSYAVFDPPYSPRQLKECYKGKGEYDTKASTWSNWKNLIAKKVKIGGKVISFGWSSQGMGKNRGFEIIRILLVPHGGMHNDTIVTVERKVSS